MKGKREVFDVNKEVHTIPIESLNINNCEIHVNKDDGAIEVIYIMANESGRDNAKCKVEFTAASELVNVLNWTVMGKKSFDGFADELSQTVAKLTDVIESYDGDVEEMFDDNITAGWSKHGSMMYVFRSELNKFLELYRSLNILRDIRQLCTCKQFKTVYDLTSSERPLQVTTVNNESFSGKMDKITGIVFAHNIFSFEEPKIVGKRGRASELMCLIKASDIMVKDYKG